MKNEILTIVRDSGDVIKGLMGGLVYALFQYIRGKNSSPSVILATLIVAGIIGQIAGQVLPVDTELRDAYISMSGILAIPIVEILTDLGPLFLREKFKSLFGIKTKEDQ